MEFDLNCWYVSIDKIAQLAGASWLPERPINEIADNLDRLRIVAAAKDATLDLLRRRRVATLEAQIIQGTLVEGSLFTCHRDYYGKGLHGRSPVDADLLRGEMAEVYSNLRALPNFKRLSVHYHPSNIHSVSGWSALGGHSRLFVAGYVERIEGEVIRARPLVIANVIAKEGDGDISNVLDGYGRVYPEMIEEFKGIREVNHRPSRSEMAVLKEIPESKIKSIFATLLRLPDFPNDWGGERSDLFSGDVHIGSRRLSAAFIFKGPASFRKMTLAVLGKNGDQIVRAFTEPAELVVLQHCHDIDTMVISNMRAFATRAGDQRLYCAIDGRDTWRLLKAYGYLTGIRSNL